jgi:hypothetical protein
VSMPRNLDAILPLNSQQMPTTQRLAFRELA